MTVPLAIAYVLVTCLFLLIGYTTTPRRRLHLDLFIVASILWPLSLLAVIGHVCIERTRGHSPKKTAQVARMPAEPRATLQTAETRHR